MSKESRQTGVDIVPTKFLMLAFGNFPMFPVHICFAGIRTELMTCQATSRASFSWRFTSSASPTCRLSRCVENTSGQRAASRWIRKRIVFQMEAAGVQHRLQWQQQQQQVQPQQRQLQQRQQYTNLAPSMKHEEPKGVIGFALKR